MQLNTKDRTLDFSLNTLMSTLFHLKAGKDGVNLTGKTGDYHFSSKEVLDSLELMLAHRTNTQLSWDNLQEYITNREYVEDVQAILQWAIAANVVLPAPEVITQDGRMLYHVKMDAEDLWELLESYINSLTAPTYFADKLEKLHIWDRLGVKAAPNLRYVRYLLDQLSDWPWAIFYSRSVMGIQLELFWSTEYGEEEQAIVPIRLPKNVTAHVTFLDYRYNTHWYINITDNVLTGRVEYNGQQPCSFSLRDTKEGLKLDLEYSPDSRYYYQLSMVWYHTQPASFLSGSDMQSQTIISKKEESIPLVTFHFSAGEKWYHSYRMNKAVIVQGSIFRTGQKYNANIRIRDISASSIYEISAYLQQSIQDQTSWNVIWSINSFSYALVPMMEYSGDMAIKGSFIPD